MSRRSRCVGLRETHTLPHAAATWTHSDWAVLSLLQFSYLFFYSYCSFSRLCFQFLCNFLSVCFLSLLAVLVLSVSNFPPDLTHNIIWFRLNGANLFISKQSWFKFVRERLRNVSNSWLTLASEVKGGDTWEICLNTEQLQCLHYRAAGGHEKTCFHINKSRTVNCCVNKTLIKTQSVKSD